MLLLSSATVVVERYSFHKRVSRILSTGGCGVHPPGRHPPRADTPHAGPSSPRQTPSPWGDPPPPQTATAADGTHPTGMHSC